MSGVHQNQVCRIHEVVSEELKRNFHKNFLHEKHPNISNGPIDLASDKIDMATFESLQRGELLGLKFYDYRKNGYLGKTTQFCMIYMDFIYLFIYLFYLFTLYLTLTYKLKIHTFIKKLKS